MCVLTLKSSHRPDGKMAHALALILACATANDASINYSGYVPQRPAISHRPHGRLMFCSFLQGGGVFVHSGTVTMTSCSITGNTASGSVRAHVETSHRPMGKLLMRLPQLSLAQLRPTLWSTTQWVRAAETSNFPIAPMGKLLTRLPRLTLAQLRTLRSSTGCTCCRDLANVPSPRWENC